MGFVSLFLYYFYLSLLLSVFAEDRRKDKHGEGLEPEPGVFDFAPFCIIEVFALPAFSSMVLLFLLCFFSFFLLAFSKVNGAMGVQ